MATGNGKNRKVAVIGLDSVTATEIYSLLVSGRIRDVVLVGAGGGRLIREFSDLRSMVPLSTPANVAKGTIQDAAGAEIAVISQRRADATDSLPRLQRSVAMVRTAVDDLVKAGFSGVILVTGSPIEILVRAAVEASKLPAERVFGIGNRTELCSIVSRLSEKGSLPLRRHETLPGTELPKGWCTAAGTEVTFIDTCRADCPFFESLIAEPSVAERYREGRKNHSPQRLAACVTQVCESVIDDLLTVTPVFVFRDGAVVRCTCTIDHSGAGKNAPLEEEPIAPGELAAAEKIWTMVNADRRPSLGA